MSRGDGPGSRVHTDARSSAAENIVSFLLQALTICFKYDTICNIIPDFVILLKHLSCERRTRHAQKRLEAHLGAGDDGDHAGVNAGVGGVRRPRVRQRHPRICGRFLFPAHRLHCPRRLSDGQRDAERRGEHHVLRQGWLRGGFRPDHCLRRGAGRGRRRQRPLLPACQHPKRLYDARAGHEGAPDGGRWHLRDDRV